MGQFAPEIDVETAQRGAGCGQVVRKVWIQDQCGRMHEIEVTSYGWKGLLSHAAAKMPLAVNLGMIDGHEFHWTGALVSQDWTHLADSAHLHKVGCDNRILLEYSRPFETKSPTLLAFVSACRL